MIRFTKLIITICSLVLGIVNATEEKLNLQNASNTHFYEELGIDTLIEHAAKSGLTTGEDIKRICNHINEAKIILEIGGGYGRAAHFICENMSSNAILYLVENTPSFVQILQTKFSPPVFIIDKDFRDILVSDLSHWKPDLVLWMWSGFADFGYDEQNSALKTLKKLIMPTGLVIIDLPSVQSETNATCTASSNKGIDAIIQINGVPTTFNGFVPSLDRMQELTKETGFVLEKVEEYITPLANRTRTQYFLRNIPK